MADTTTPQLQIALPGAGNTTTFSLSPDTPIKFDFDISEAVISGTDGNLEIAIEGGGTVILENYQELAESGSLPTFELIGGEEVPGDVYMFAFDNADNTADDVETAADGAAGGSGAGEYSDDAGTLFDGINALGGQGDAYDTHQFQVLTGVLGNVNPVAVDDFAEITEEGDPDFIIGRNIIFVNSEQDYTDALENLGLENNPGELGDFYPLSSGGGFYLYYPNPPQTDETIDGNVIDNDYDPDGANSELRMFSIDYVGENHDGVDVPPVDVTGNDTVIMGKYGVLVIDSDGTWEYTLNQQWADVLDEGETYDEVFEYSIVDGIGGQSNTATLTITVNGANDAPIAHDDFNVEAVELGDSDSFDINAIVHDDDLGGETGSDVTVHDGDYDYNDGSDLTVTGNVLLGDDAGSATDTDVDGDDSADAGSLFVIGVYSHGTETYDYELPNETDLDFTPSEDQSYGTATMDADDSVTVDGTYGTLTINADGSYSYELYSEGDDGYDALNSLNYLSEDNTDSFTYAIMDDSGAPSYSTITFTVNGANDAPEVSPDTAEVIEFGEEHLVGEDSVSDVSVVSGNILSNDSDVDDNDLSNEPGETSNVFVGSVWSSLHEGGFQIEAVQEPGGDNGDDDGNYYADLYVDDGDTDIYNGTDLSENAVSKYPGYIAVDGQYGTLYINADGDYHYEVDNENADVQALNYDADTENGILDELTETFHYIARNSYEDGVESDESTLTITINGSNDAPVAVNDGFNTQNGYTDLGGETVASAKESGEHHDPVEDVPAIDVTGNVLTNDTDVDTAHDDLTVTDIDANANSNEPTTDDDGNLVIVGEYGTLTIAADGTYTYTANTDAANHLAEGDLVTDSFTYTVSDNNDTYEGVREAVLTIQVEGTNDAPTISVTDSTGFTELGDASAQVLTDSGTVTFDDVDTTNTVDITFEATGDPVWSGGDLDDVDTSLANTLLNGFSTGADDVNPDGPETVGWTYNTTADLDFLAQGETLTFSYVVTATDNDGGVASDTVTFTVTGTNDAPTVEAEAQSEAFVEAADASAQDLHDSGDISFTDVDVNDLVGVSSAYNGDIEWSNSDDTTNDLDADLITALTNGTFTATATATDNEGNTTWTYDAEDLDLDFLADGDTITFSYDITATDNNGATGTDTVTITIVGSNDAADISGDTSDSVTEVQWVEGGVDVNDPLTFVNDTDAHDDFGDSSGNGTDAYGNLIVDPADTTLTASGTLTISDPDVHTDDMVTFQNLDGQDVSVNIEETFQTIDDLTNPDGYGSFSINELGEWTYEVDNDLDAIQQLGDGESLTETFTVTSYDGSDTETVTVTINGSNDAPVITSVSAPVEDFEDGASGWSDNTVTETTTAFSDFLGRFGNGTDLVEKTFDVADGADSVTIDFDMYEIDSWTQSDAYGFDNFVFIVDGEEVVIPLERSLRDDSDADDAAVRTGTITTENGTITWTFTATEPGTTNQGFAGYEDQIHHVTITITNPGDTVTLGLDSTLDEAISNESFGIDNVVVASYEGGELILSIDENLEGSIAVAQLDSTDVEGQAVHYVIDKVVDADGNDVTADGLFIVDGDQILTADGVSFDYEANNEYTITVSPVDSQGAVGQDVDITIQVNDVNEPPVGADFTIFGTSFDTPIPIDFDGDNRITDAEDDYSTTDDLDTGVIITSLPEGGTLYYNDGNQITEVTQADVDNGTRYDDLDGFTYESDGGPEHQGLLLGSRTADDAGLSTWGEAVPGNSSSRVVHFDSDGDGTADVDITTTISSGALKVFSDQQNHIDHGLANASNNGLTEGETLTIGFDGKDVSQAEIGFGGLGGYFDDNADAEGVATWAVYNDGELIAYGEVSNETMTWTNEVTGQSDTITGGDGDTFQSLVLDQSILQGQSFDQIVFSTNDAYDADDSSTRDWNSNWELQYVDVEFAENDSFTYRPVDSEGLVNDGDPYEVTIDLLPGSVNEDPLAVDDANSVHEPNTETPTAAEDFASTVSANVLTNDVDLDNTTSEMSLTQVSYGDTTVDFVTGSITGDDATFNADGTVTFQGEHGTLTIGADGEYTYTATDNSLAPGDAPTETFTYTMTDGDTVDNDETAQTADLVITVNGLNDGPDAVDDGKNGVDWQNHAFTADFTTGLEHTGVTIVDGTTDTPISHSQFGLGISTGSGDNSAIETTQGTETVILQFDIPQESATITLADFNNTDHDDDAIIKLYDADHNLVGTIEVGTDLTDPTIQLIGDEPFTYVEVTPAGGAEDGFYIQSVSGVTADYAYTDGTIETPEDTPITIDVLANDTDPEGDALTITEYDTQATDGNGNVVGTVSLVNGELVFTPAADYNGPAEFEYTIEDPYGESDTATVYLNVTPVNDAPVGIDDANTIDEDTTATGNVIDGDTFGGQADTDVDGDDLSLTGFQVDGDSTQYAAGDTATIDGVGQLTMNENGTYTFVPADDYNGDVPTVTYTVSDGLASDTAELTIDITAVNDGPVANDDTNTILEDTTATGNVIAGDSYGGEADTDVDGDTLTLSGFTVDGDSYTVPAGGSETAVIDGVGSLTIGSDGAYTFTPDADWNGDVPTVTYTVTDGEETDTADLDITVDPVNDAPTLDLSMGTVTYEGEEAGYNNMLGVYTLDEDGNPVDPQIILENVNDPSLNVGDVLATYEDGQELHYFMVSVEYGATPQGEAEFTYNETTGQWDITIGNTTYDARFDDANLNNGDPEATFDIDDITDGRTIGVDDQLIAGGPQSGDDDDFDDILAQEHDNPGDGFENTFVEDGPAVHITGEVNISDVDSDQISQAVINLDNAKDGDSLNVDNLPAGITVDPSSTATHIILTGDASLEDYETAIEQITFSNSSDTPDTTDRSVSVQVWDVDADGSNDLPSNEAEATIHVVPVNDGPVAQDDLATATGTAIVGGNEDTSWNLDTILIAQQKVDGDWVEADLIKSPGQSDHYGVGSDAEGNVTGNEQNVNGSTERLVVDFGDEAQDGAQLTITGSGSAAEVHVYSNGVEVTDSLAISVDGNKINIVQDNDSNTPIVSFDEIEVSPAGSSDKFALADVTSTPGNVGGYEVPIAEGNVLGGPDAASGDVYDYDVDGVDYGDTPNNATSLKVTGVTSGNLEETEQLTADNDDSVTLTGVDADGETIQGTYGTLFIDAAGNYTYTPNEGEYGNVTESFTYQIEDADGQIDYGVINVDIDVNTPPVAADDTVSTPEATPVEIDVLANDTDADADSLNVDSFTQGEHGTVTFDSDGNATYTPDADFHGTDSFTYTVSDGNGGTSTATVDVTVTSVNDAPDAVDDLYNTNTGYNVVAEAGAETTVSVPNYLIMLDRSSSMDWDDRIEPAEDAVISMLQQLQATLADGQEVKIGLVEFANSASTTTFTLVGGAPDSADGLNDAIAHIDTGVTYAWTNYDEALTAGYDWAVANSGDTQAIFISDGDPTTDNPNIDWRDVSDALADLDGVHVTSIGIGGAIDQANLDYINEDGTAQIISDDDTDGLHNLLTTIVSETTGDPTIATGNVLDGHDDGTGTNTLAGTDSDPDGDTLEVVSIAHGSDSTNLTDVTPDDGVDNPTATIVGTYGTLTINADGSYDYTPDQVAANALGDGESATDTFTYTITDGNNGTDSANITFLVNGANDAPVAVDDLSHGVMVTDTLVTTKNYEWVAGNTTHVNFNDTDGTDRWTHVADELGLRVSGTNDLQRAHVTQVRGGIGIASHEDNNWGWNHSKYDDYSSEIGHGLKSWKWGYNTSSSEATETLNLDFGNDDQDMPLTVNITVRNVGTGEGIVFHIVDSNGNTYTFDTTNGTNGSQWTDVTGSVTLTKNNSEQYTVTGLQGDSDDNGQVLLDTISLEPGASTSFYLAAIDVTGASSYEVTSTTTTGEQTAVAITGNLLDNDFDPESDNLSVEIIGAAASHWGTLTILDANTGEYQYTPNADHIFDDTNGLDGTIVDQFTYQVTDADGLTDTATLYIPLHYNMTATPDGTTGNDLVYGTDGNDTITGMEGNDFLYGEGGDDHIFGGDDADYISGGDGNDLIHGGDGNDYLFGDNGNDTIWGGGGDDIISAGSGDDTVITSSGNDTVTLGSGADTITIDPAYLDGDGHMTVTDFNLNDGDQIDLSGLSGGVVSLDAGENSGDLILSIADVNPGGDDITIVLQGVLPATHDTVDHDFNISTDDDINHLIQQIVDSPDQN